MAEPTGGVFLEVWEGRRINIMTENDNGVGSGYRIAGPKFAGSDPARMIRHRLDERDAWAILGHLAPLIDPEAADD